MSSLNSELKVFEEKQLHLSGTYLPFSAFVNNSGVDVKCHWHNHIEMLYLIKGKAIIYINDEAFDFYEGDFIIINSNDIHFTKSLDSPEFLVIQFKSSVIRPDLDLPFEAKYFLPFLQKELKYIKDMNPHNDNKLKGLLDEILQDFQEKYDGYELNVKANIYKIFSWLIKNEYIKLPSMIGIDNAVISKMSVLIEYISDSYDENITIEAASKMVYMSYHHFCRIFKKVTGKTFIQYLNFVRLREAEKLLIMSDNSVSEISVSVGFKNTSYFTHIFKKEKGVSPMAYRKSNRFKL